MGNQLSPTPCKLLETCVYLKGVNPAGSTFRRWAGMLNGDGIRPIRFKPRSTTIASQAIHLYCTLANAYLQCGKFHLSCVYKKSNNSDELPNGISVQEFLEPDFVTGC